MAFGRKKNAGFDLSGVGRGSRKLSGGRAKNRSGFVMAPHSSLPGSRGRSSAGIGNARRSGSRRTVVLVALLVVFALALSTLVGFLVYQQTVRNALKADIDTAALANVLVPVESALDPYWFALVHTDSSSAEEGRGEVSHLALGYIDPDNKSMSVLWIPADTRVYIDGYGYHQIKDAFSLGLESGVVGAMAKLANVDVAHYLEVNDLGLSRLESSLGISEAEVSQDSPISVVSAVAKKVFGASSEQMATRAGHLAACMATDVDQSTLTSLCTALQGMNTDSDIYSEQMPASPEEADGVTYSMVDAGSWGTMVTRVSSGMTPVATQKELGGYEQIRAKNTVTIWNGVGVSGVARDCADELKKHGWHVGSTGNAASYVYGETLVVYKDNDDEAAAELLVSDLGQGRAVRSAMRYSFTGDILVVVGKDYQPY